jgi:hypothetical protein
MPAPVVILVGGPKTGKTQFYVQYTNALTNPPTVKSTPNVALHTNPTIVLVDTPGVVNYRNIFEYSWQGIFRLADLIVNFGGWSESEIHGISRKVPVITWSGDNAETMKRIEEYLQYR